MSFKVRLSDQCYVTSDLSPSNQFVTSKLFAEDVCQVLKKLLETNTPEDITWKWTPIRFKNKDVHVRIIVDDRYKDSKFMRRDEVCILFNKAYNVGDHRFKAAWAKFDYDYFNEDTISIASIFAYNQD